MARSGFTLLAGATNLFKVTITNPDGEDFVVLVDGESAVLGRSPEVDITVPNPLVSARHLRIDAGAIVRDLRSKNGSWSRGDRLSGPTLIGENTVVLGPDPERSPTVRVDLVLPDEIEELDIEDQTLAYAPEEEGAVRIVRPVNGGPPPSLAPSLGESSHISIAGRRDATVIHPLLKSNPLPSVNGSDASQAFVVDACLQSLRSLETLMRPIGESTGKGNGTSKDSEILAALETVLAKGEDPRARQEFLDVLANQRQHILDRYYAYRRASTLLVEELRDRILTESNLSGYSGIPFWKKVLGMRWRILWTRTREHLEHHDRSRIEARLDDLAREASRLPNEHDSGR